MSDSTSALRQAFGVVRAAFHEPETRLYQVVAGVIWSLILTSIAVLGAQAVLPATHLYRAALERADAVILTVFALELVLRVTSYEPSDLKVFNRPPLGRVRAHLLGRVRYLLQPPLLIDLVTVLALVPALRGLRALRLLRLLRSLRWFRYGNPFTGLFHAFERDRLLFALAFSFLFLQVALGGVSLLLIESRANPDLRYPPERAAELLELVPDLHAGEAVRELAPALQGVGSRPGERRRHVRILPSAQLRHAHPRPAHDLKRRPPGAERAAAHKRAIDVDSPLPRELCCP